MAFNYTFKLTDSKSKITLPRLLPTSGKKLKIKSLSYTTAAAGYQLMIIKVQGFCNNYYYDGVESIDFTKAIPLSAAINTPVIYDNYFTSYDVENSEAPGSKALGQLTIEILIDKQHQGISGSNPVYIELEIH